MYSLNAFCQKYPISTTELGWTNRSYYRQTRQTPLVMNNDGTITATGDFNEYKKLAVANTFIPCRMNLSIVDLFRTRGSDQEKTLRFGDLIGLSPIYGGSVKLFEPDNTTKKAIAFGTGFFLGAFVLYHFDRDLGVGLSYRWDVSLDAFDDGKSNYSYYVPLSYFSILGHYKKFSLEFSTTLKSEPTVAKMISSQNKKLAKGKMDNVTAYNFGTAQLIDLKYFFGKKKVYLTVKYEFLNGQTYEGNQDRSKANLADDTPYTQPFSDFKLGMKERFNTLNVGVGFKL